MRKIPGLVVLLISNSFIFGQTTYRPAIVVDNQGDSIPGKISYHNWKRNPKKVDFINNNNEKQVLDPASIKSFFLINEQERYVSYNINIDETPDNYMEAYSKKTTSPSSSQQKSFLLQLVKGETLTLYSFSDNHKNHFYYSKGNEIPVELIFHFLYIENTGEVKTVTTYLQQLSNLMSGCSEAAGKINRVQFVEKEVKRIFLEYLKCNKEGIASVTKENNSAPVRFGVIGGLMYNSFSFSGDGHITSEEYSDIAIDNYSSNLSPVAGVSLDISFKRTYNKWHIVNELIFKTYKTNNTAYTNTILYDYKNEIDLSFSYIQLNSFMRYVISVKPVIQPFVTLGIGNALRISENKNTSHITYDNGTEKTTVAIDGAEKYERSLLFGIGVTSKKIQLEGRYSFSNGFSPYTRFSSKVSSPQIILTYQF